MNTNENSGILFRIFLYLKNKFDPKPPVAEEVQTCTQIVLKVLEYDDTELTYTPISNKRFIVNDTRGMAITIEHRVVHIINHIYSYSVYMEDNDCYGKVLKKFDEVSERKKTGTKLCARGKSAAQSKFKVYPSAYANGYAVQVCKGKIKGLDGKKQCSGAYC